MAETTEVINVTITEAQPILVTMVEQETIHISIDSSGPQGFQGPAGPNSHIHADPKATTRIMEYIEEYKAYEINE